MSEPTSLPLREKIEAKFKWNLCDIFQSDEKMGRNFSVS